MKTRLSNSGRVARVWEGDYLVGRARLLGPVPVRGDWAFTFSGQHGELTADYMRDSQVWRDRYAEIARVVDLAYDRAAARVAIDAAQAARRANADIERPAGFSSYANDRARRALN